MYSGSLVFTQVMDFLPLKAFWRCVARYPDRLRRVRFRDVETKKTLIFITNDFVLPAHVIAALYKARWQVELFL